MNSFKIEVIVFNTEEDNLEKCKSFWYFLVHASGAYLQSLHD